MRLEAAMVRSAPTRLEAQRREILRRQADLAARLGEMPEETLRWIVRVLGDCLPPTEQAELLAGYDEAAGEAGLRAFLEAFLPAYTGRALAALDGRAEVDRPGLRDLSDEELQGMAAVEKWELLAADPGGLRPYQLARELARLFMCQTFDLFHDTGVGEAAVEFPTYFRIERALQALAPAALTALRDQVLSRARDLCAGEPPLVEAALEGARQAIGRAAGFGEPPRPHPADRMARIAFADPARAAVPVAPWLAEGLAAAPPEALRLSLRVLLDLCGVDAARAALHALRRQHASLAAVPPQDLRVAIEALAARMGDRGITDFAERYRSGRFLALPHAAAGAWEALTPAERLRALEADNAAMDAAQAARHLARLLLTPTWEALLDPAAQVGLLDDARYDRAVAALMGLGGKALPELNAAITRLVADLMWGPAAGRAAGLAAVRWTIAAALGPPAAPPAP